MTEALRPGLTTGSCAAAATKAAALALKGISIENVTLGLPDGSAVEVDVTWARVVTEGLEAQAVVRKDAGDDPDITNGMLVVVNVKRRSEAGFSFLAGEGVGTVTKPGLQIPPGEAAINPVPRRMMITAFQEVFPNEGATFTVSVPGGQEKAQNTFNPRLGILGGISILGTSGRVIPRSEEAWLRSLLPQIDMAVAQGLTTLFVTPGSFGLALRKELPPVADDAVIHAGNFVGDILLECRKRGAKEIVLAGHAGKLVKVAAGIFNTHSRHGDARLETVAALAAAAGASPLLVQRLLEANTTEDAATLLSREKLDSVWNDVAERASRRASAHCGLPVHCALTNYHGDLIGTSKNIEQKKPASPHHPRLAVVGVGPGTPEWLSPAAWRVIREADVLVGGARHLEELATSHKKCLKLGARLEELKPELEVLKGKRIVFLASGDPGLFGLLAFVRRTWENECLEVVPGVSSFALAAARLSLAWEEVKLASVHGRSLEALRAEVESHTRLLVLTDKTHSPERLARALSDWGVDASLTVLENLSYDHETITRGSPAQIAGRSFDALSVVFIDRSPARSLPE